jgi:hypothetical protein
MGAPTLRGGNGRACSMIMQRASSTGTIGHGLDRSRLAIPRCSPLVHLGAATWVWVASLRKPTHDDSSSAPQSVQPVAVQAYSDSTLTQSHDGGIEQIDTGTGFS